MAGFAGVDAPEAGRGATQDRLTIDRMRLSISRMGKTKETAPRFQVKEYALPFGNVRTEKSSRKKLPDALSVHLAVVSGIAVSAVLEMAGLLEISEDEMARHIDIPRSTYHRYRSKGGRLDLLRSDAIEKFASLYRQACETFGGDKEAARQWLKAPQVGLAHQVPLQLARTTVGFREVQKLLTRINEGVYA